MSYLTALRGMVETDRIELEQHWSETVKGRQRTIYLRWTPAEIERTDADLAYRFEKQLQDFWAAVRGGNNHALRLQGEATLRGFDAIEKRMSQTDAILDLNRAKPQKGFGPDPGPSPGRGSARFHAWFAAYLLTEAWARRRDAVLRRCEGACEGCSESPAAQVHHLTYEHVGRELLFELVGLCRKCHAIVHGRAA